MYLVDIKTYHPPPEPPPIPNIVCPPAPKRQDNKVAEAAHVDNIKHDIRRSFASSDDYDDRDGKSHVISISDGESENYYAGINSNYLLFQNQRSANSSV